MEQKDIIIKPYITEKTALLQDQNIYVFEVGAEANKSEVKKEIKRIYKVEPVKVNISYKPDKKVFVRGKVGTKRGFKKAFVYLKKGDKINIM